MNIFFLQKNDFIDLIFDILVYWKELIESNKQSHL